MQLRVAELPAAANAIVKVINTAKVFLAVCSALFFLVCDAVKNVIGTRFDITFQVIVHVLCSGQRTFHLFHVQFDDGINDVGFGVAPAADDFGAGQG